MEQGKTCSKCGEWKPFEGFYFRKSRNQYTSDCKECTKQYYQENKEDILNKRKQRYLNQSKQRYLNQSKQQYQENKEDILNQRKHYYQENKEKIKKYQQENAEQIKERKKQYYQKNKERTNENTRKYLQTEKGKENNYRRRLKRKSYKNNVKFKPHQRKQILDRDKWRCQSCGIKVHDRYIGDWNTPDKAHIDHIIPISKGGNSEPSNLQTLCRTCNLSKSDKIEQQLSLF